MRRITIKDIARDLQLSVSTVSRGLAGDKSISDYTKSRIEESAERLGYRRNLLASKLRKGRTNTIGVLIGELESSLVSDMVEGVQETMQRRDIGVLIANSANNPERELAHLRMFETAMVDGLVVSLCDKSDNIHHFQRLISMGMPIVFCDCVGGNKELNQVRVNHYKKTFFLLDHILRSGRRRVVHLKGVSKLPRYSLLSDAFKDVLRKYDVAPADCPEIETDISAEGGRRAIEMLVERGVKFDAVFACNEYVAIGAMNRLRELGKNVPADVAVAGYSGSRLSMMVFPPLTTVETPMKRMGEMAAELLIDKFDNPEAPHKQVELEGSIKLRDSSV